MHPVDSNEISFKLAGRNAFKEAFKNAGPKILEPIYDIEVIVPEEKMGDVMTDLQGRRAIIMGMDSEGSYQKILAKVPLAELNRYSTALSSLTSGRATYNMKFGEYTQVPGDVQDKLLKLTKNRKKTKNNLYLVETVKPGNLTGFFYTRYTGLTTSGKNENGKSYRQT